MANFLVTVENREGPIKSVLSVRVSVSRSRIISETAPRIFPKLGTKLWAKNVRNVARLLFSNFCPFSRKPLIYAKKSHFWQFLGLCRKSVPRIFLKFCQNVPKKFQKIGQSRFAWENFIFLRFWVTLYPKINVSDPKF